MYWTISRSGWCTFIHETDEIDHSKMHPSFNLLKYDKWTQLTQFKHKRVTINEYAISIALKKDEKYICFTTLVVYCNKTWVPSDEMAQYYVLAILNGSLTASLGLWHIFDYKSLWQIDHYKARCRTRSDDCTLFVSGPDALRYFDIEETAYRNGQALVQGDMETNSNHN